MLRINRLALQEDPVSFLDSGSFRRKLKLIFCSLTQQLIGTEFSKAYSNMTRKNSLWVKSKFPESFSRILFHCIDRTYNDILQNILDNLNSEFYIANTS